MKSPQFTLYLLCFFWTIGIVFSFYFRAPLPLLLGISFFLALFLLLNIKRNPIPLWGKSILFYLLTLCLAFTQGLQKQKLSPQHFLRNYIPGDSVQLRLMLFEKLRSSENQMRFYAMVKSKNGIPTNGKLLLNIRTEKKLPLQLGNILEIKTVILPLDEPKNPGEFHYKNYLKTQGVYAKLSFVPPKKIMSISSDSSWILKIKARAVQKIVESSFSTESKGLILAMLFGGRNTIPREKMNEFRDAGILHILAISGLHVGLLLLVFQFLFSPLKRIGKHSAFYHLLVLGCLWIYAFGVGASPSVIRAVTMFSVFSVGALSKRKRPNIVLVIADGSSPNYIKRKWANTCKEYGIPFHDTAEKGAIEISPENEEQSFVYNFRNLLRH